MSHRRAVAGAVVAIVVLLAAPGTGAAECVPGERPLDGTCSAPLDRGRAGSSFIRVDGRELPPPSPPQARELSNLFLAQDPIPGIGTLETVLIPLEDLKQGPHPDPHGLNQLAVAFGQAVTHDLTKVRIGFSPAAIGARDFQYAPDDPLCQMLAETSATTIYYLPCTGVTTANGDGTTTIRLNDDSRYTFVDGTSWTYFRGPFEITVPSSMSVHRRSSFPLATTLIDSLPVNDVTSFLDLSLVYGNSAAVNSVLRANDGSGRLRTAPDGEIPFGPGVPNDCGAFDEVTSPVSASGDSRVDENLFLDLVHSLLFRNHNRDAEWVAANHPELTSDEQRFQRARAINIARFQQQVYNELLPAVFGRRAVQRYVGPYRGFAPGADPRITTTFDIALRVAHAQVALPPYVVDGAGRLVTIEGTLGFPSHARPNCLFTTFRDVGGAAIARSAMAQSGQEVTGAVSDLMRNVVFRTANGQNTAGFNLDIEQLNIIRGREFGTPNFDTLRRHWRGSSVYERSGCSRAPEAGADALRCFEHVTDDRDVARRLRDVYRHVDRIDAFIGLMLEKDHRRRFPPTATRVILEQFRRTRAADRWFYLNRTNPHLNFSHAERERIDETVAQSLEASYGLRNLQDAFRVRSAVSRRSSR